MVLHGVTPLPDEQFLQYPAKSQELSLILYRFPQHLGFLQVYKFLIKDSADTPNGTWKEESGESTSSLVGRLVSYMLAPFAVFFSSQTASLGLEA